MSSYKTYSEIKTEFMEYVQDLTFSICPDFSTSSDVKIQTNNPEQVRRAHAYILRDALQVKKEENDALFEKAITLEKMLSEANERIHHLQNVMESNGWTPSEGVCKDDVQTEVFDHLARIKDGEPFLETESKFHVAVKMLSNSWTKCQEMAEEIRREKEIVNADEVEQEIEEILEKIDDEDEEFLFISNAGRFNVAVNMLHTERAQKLKYKAKRDTFKKSWEDQRTRIVDLENLILAKDINKSLELEKKDEEIKEHLRIIEDLNKKNRELFMKNVKLLSEKNDQEVMSNKRKREEEEVKMRKLIILD